MNIKQLETFLEIVRRGSFAAAAEHLHATPSTISARIQDLEDDLGTLLFDRSQRGAALTAKGRALLVYAERALSAFDEIRTKVGSGDALTGLIRLGVAEMVAVTWLPALVGLIHSHYPRLVLELTVSLTAELQDGLDKGILDIVFLPGVRFDPALSVRSLGSVQFAWMAGRSVVLPDTIIQPRDLGPMRVLSLGKDSFHYRTVDHWLKLQGDAFHSVDVCNSMSVIAWLTQAGIGVSLLPLLSYRAEIDNGDLRVLQTCPEGPVVEFYAVYTDKPASPLPALIAALAVQASTFDPRPDQPLEGATPVVRPPS